MENIIHRNQCRARKQHVCDLCGDVIEKGTEYIKTSWREEGEFAQSKTHIHCDALVIEYLKQFPYEAEAYSFQDVRNWIRENCYGCVPCANTHGCMEACEMILYKLLPYPVRNAAIQSARRVCDD